ncbi:MAG: peptidylprolyl isomerase [Candidatus Delongbacteria bacterium]|nr:peptidylprolyl isomerase [Candidatus Delongbacteria bacterium]MBN2836585.1 peptidylprolyl isomerase [Candidatus Delongbacteria bacterium]
MQIKKNAVVVAEYELWDDENVLIDSVVEGDTIDFILGMDYFPEKIEEALIGKKAGDVVEISVEAKDGFGEIDEDLILEASKKDFEDFDSLEIGTEFELDTEDGVLEGIITAIEDDKVIGDCNHPLAGINLKFRFKIVDVREATEEELEHGHVHGEGCCGHDHDEE